MGGRKIMRKIVSIILLIIMIMFAVTANASSRKDVSDSMIEYTKDVMKDVLDIYKKNGTLDDGNLELGFSYFMMYLAAKRTSSLEIFYPSAYFQTVKADSWANTESVISGYWIKLLDGEIEREKFEMLLMGLIESKLKE